MKALNKFTDIWVDLEKSYVNMKDKLNVNNRKDYLVKILFNRNGELIIDNIKSLLLNEVSTYNEDELNAYSTLIDLLDAVKLYFENIDINVFEVDNLNSIIINSLDLKHNKIKEKVLTTEMLLEEFTYNARYKEMDSMNLFRYFGSIRSFSEVYNGRTNVVKFKESIVNPFFYVSASTLPLFFDIINKYKIGNLNNLFLENNIQFIGNLFTMNIFNVIVCSKELLQGSKLLGRKIKKEQAFDSDEIYSYDGIVIYLV